MMMGGDKKKIAALIIKGMGSSKPKSDSTDFVDKGEDQEDEKDYHRHGIEAAMEKLIKAIHSKDTDMAVEAFMECKECSEGYDPEYDDSYMGKKED